MASLDETKWLDDREQRAWRAFLSAHAQLSARLSRRLQADTGLSSADYEVLVVLSEAPDRRMRPFQLGGALGWEKSRLSHQLTRMEGRGLVERRNCETDGRGAYVALTDHGWRAIEAAAPAHVAEVRKAFLDALTPRQLDTLAKISEAVIARLAEDGVDDLCDR